MEKETDERKELFLKNLNAPTYYETMIEAEHELGCVEFYLISMHEFLKSGRFKGSKLLDIGSGPTVHNIASASAYFPNIVLSEFVSDNREELKRWLDGKSEFDWSYFLNIAAKLEGYGNDLAKGRNVIESRIRKNVKCVVPSDLLTDSILPLNMVDKPETAPPYDLIISSLCICVVPKDVEEYIVILKRINRLLRKGGGFMISEFINGSPWRCGDMIYPCIKMDWGEYIRAFDEAGFGKLEIKVKNRPKSDYYYQYDKAFCIAAEKL